MIVMYSEWYIYTLFSVYTLVETRGNDDTKTEADEREATEHS